MKNLTISQAIDIIRWTETIGAGNWGGWRDYPNLPIGAQYLSYDVNHIQINLSEPVIIDGEEYDCITHSRKEVQGKGRKAISIYSLKCWCLPEVVRIEAEERKAAINEDYRNALASFHKLPVQMQNALLDLTIESCGSNNARKKAIGKFTAEHAEIIIPIMTEAKRVRKIIDCIQFNHTYFA